ncbi:hypothetical protein ACIHEI_37055 [Kitasatospora sp. NPDC051984]|uniref:hypothetical protein n=1 Tax=Kitasatospora sp. NPDC051984 TaxID=3364059 RepID=UPI0037CCAA49
MRLRKLIAAAGIATTVAGFGLVNAGEASAFTVDCSANNACLYYNSSAYGYGAYYEQVYNTPDYAGLTFRAGHNGSSGAGVAVKNHAAAVDNRYGVSFTVYYNSNYNCSVACQVIPANARVDLNASVKNNNASGSW